MVKNIMYHYIRDSSVKSNSGLNFKNISEFINQLDFFKKKYKPLTINDYKFNREFYINSKDKYYVLTFDDGYKEHGDIVMEELVKRGMTGVFFIPSSITNANSLLDVNLLHLILAKANKNKVLFELENILKFHKKEYSEYLILKDNYINKSRYDDKLTSFLKFILQSSFDSKFRRSILDLLWDIFMIDTQNDIAKKIYLNKEELEGMLRYNMVIGGHGCDHVHLSKVNFKKQQSEIKSSSLFLDSLNENKKHPKCFAYPYGSYNDVTLKLMVNHGFDLSFTTNPVNDNIIHSNLEIPRLDTNDIK